MSKAYQDGIADGEAGRPPTPGRRGAYACGYVIGSGRRDERKMAEALAGKAGAGGHPDDGAAHLLEAAVELLRQVGDRDRDYWPELDALREAVADVQGRTLEDVYANP